MVEKEEKLELSEELTRYLCNSGKGNGLELIKSIPNISLHARGNLLTMTGSVESLKRVRRFIKLLEKRLAKRDHIEPQELRFMFEEFRDTESCKTNELLREILHTHSGRSIKPLTFNQQAYIDSINKNTITIVTGPAGSGKTYLAVAMAVLYLKEKKVNRLILSRPTIEAGEKLGFLPGDLLEKVDPHFRPLYDALHEFLGVSKFQQLLRQGTIEITPLGFMRGRTFNEAFIIVDEAQNTTVLQMKMLLTRLGFGSKMVITGDHTQIDLPNPRDSSLRTLGEILKDIEDISFIRLQSKDVVRHELVRKIVNAYEAYLSTGDRK